MNAEEGLYTLLVLRKAILILILFIAGCSDDPSAAGCSLDADCGTGELCQRGACISANRLDCIPGGDTVPAIKAEPSTLDFGAIGSTAVTRQVQLKNEGTCTLQITSAALEGGASSPFRCTTCAVSYPVLVYPDRAWVVDVVLNPGGLGTINETLLVENTSPHQSKLQVPLTAQSQGMPELIVTPNELDFGFAPVGQTVERVVQVINGNAGTTSLEITKVEIPETTDAFSFTPQVTSPVTLAPAINDPNERLAITVQYHPQAEAAHAASLVVTPAAGNPVTVPLSGLEDAPEIQITQSSLDFGTVRVGQREVRTITIQNLGPSPLVASERFGAGTNPAVSFVRTLPVIAPGGLFELGVAYAPIAAGPLQETVVISANDPDETTTTLVLIGNGEAVPGAEVIAIELTFDNDSDSKLDKDLRDVDLILENPVGQICSETAPTPSWGNHGTPRWIGTPPKENPEQIVLPDALEDGTYTVNLNYVEDCATLPTALAASLLGVGSEELVDYLSEGDVKLDPSQVANVIAQVCVDHRSAGARVSVTINGASAGDFPVQLGEKGQFARAFDLVRTNGHFTVVQ